jgi:hypothetical protein
MTRWFMELSTMIIIFCVCAAIMIALTVYMCENNK